MFKRVLLGLLVVALVTVAVVARFFFSNTAFSEDVKYLYIATGSADKSHVMQNIRAGNFINNPKSFEFLASRMNVWPRLRPGKYRVRNGMSLFSLARMLRNGDQHPVNLVITKVRTCENLASLVQKKFETDSLTMIRFLRSNDSLSKYDLDSNTVMTSVFPNTYTYLWTAPPGDIFRKLHAEHQKVWNENRRQKADSLGLSPAGAYILASIIEEETTNESEKGLIASVYLNRLARGMPLGADPTVKFALKDFGLKRIYQKHLAVESPYNTYRNKGLPPGPICTPGLSTLDSVLNAPKSDFLFFVAKKDFSQGHVFTASYQQHLKFAREYQQALNERERHRRKTATEETE